MLFIGTAGWNIPRLHRERFPRDGSQLRRYAARLNAAEINTSFYRPHARAVYERWAAGVPASFRFAVKMPKAITHEGELLRARDPLARFLDEVAGLDRKLGALLVQLPPSFEFNARRVGRFLTLLRGRHAGAVVCEPRHITWTSPVADRLLADLEIARVAADPPRAAGLDVPGGYRTLAYYRWHGSPRAYFSNYSPAALDDLAARITATAAARTTWCIFDNTGSGSAAGNALDLTGRLGGVVSPRPRHRR